MDHNESDKNAFNFIRDMKYKTSLLILEYIAWKVNLTRLHVVSQIAAVSQVVKVILAMKVIRNRLFDIRTRKK